MNNWSKKKIKQILILVISIIAFNCDLNNNNSNIIMSTYGDNESHRAGENCMECHKSGGDAGIVFSIAGTIYHSNSNIVYPNVSVNLFPDINFNGIPVEIFEVDGKGNFYSSIPIDWQNGLYTSVSSVSQIKRMNSTIFDGSCNHCHGEDIPHINVE